MSVFLYSTVEDELYIKGHPKSKQQSGFRSLTFPFNFQIFSVCLFFLLAYISLYIFSYISVSNVLLFMFYRAQAVKQDYHSNILDLHCEINVADKATR